MKEDSCGSEERAGRAAMTARQARATLCCESAWRTFGRSSIRDSQEAGRSWARPSSASLGEASEGFGGVSGGVDCTAVISREAAARLDAHQRQHFSRIQTADAGLSAATGQLAVLLRLF